MSTPHIRLNGISSEQYGFRVVSVDRFLTPNTLAHREPLPGTTGGGPTVYSQPPQPIKITLGYKGIDRADAISKLQAQAKWFMNARVLELWTDPDYFFLGRVENTTPVTYIGKRFAQVSFDFMCDPPYRMKMSTTHGAESFLIPFVNDVTGLRPLAETNTFPRTGGQGNYLVPQKDVVTSPVSPSVIGTLKGSAKPSFVLEIVGTWDYGLKISNEYGSVEDGIVLLGGAGTSQKLYIDHLNGYVYQIKGGKRVMHPHAGQVKLIPWLDDNIYATDANSNFKARLISIEGG